MNPDDFILDTDYPIDKIIGSSAGSFTRDDTNYLTPHTFSHGFSFAPLYILQWSTSPSFVPAYSEQLMPDGLSPLLEAQTDITTTYLYAAIPSGGGTITFYYRVIYFMPPGINVQANETSSAYNEYIFNTDRNYPKIYRQGSTPSATIQHNLGYIPLVDFWIHRVSDGMIRHFPVTETDAGNEGGVIVNEDNIQILLPSGHDFAYYKIYADRT